MPEGYYPKIHSCMWFHNQALQRAQGGCACTPLRRRCRPTPPIIVGHIRLNIFTNGVKVGLFGGAVVLALFCVARRVPLRHVGAAELVQQCLPQ